MDKCTVSLETLLKFKERYPEKVSSLKVNSRNGFVNIQDIFLSKVNSKVYKIVFENGAFVESSPEHRLWTNKWTYVKDLNIGDNVLSEIGYTRVISKEVLCQKEDLYDMSVDGHEYYVNGIVSHNSSIIEAIYFAIYGKSFRKVNKDSLINSINKKNMLVTLELEVNKTNFTIKRGIKPNIFEIYVDGILKPQTANVKDYQKWLQSTVLHMDEKTFRQVITMGSTSFIPFMRLSAAERRTVIEDLLNIDIISQMMIVAKSRANKIDKEVNKLGMHITNMGFNIESMKQSASTINENIAASIERVDAELFAIKEESKIIIDKITELKAKSDPDRYKELSEMHTTIDKYISDGTKLLYSKQHTLKSIENNINFFTGKSECPYCTQELTEEFLENKRLELNDKHNTVSNNIQEINDTINQLIEKNKKIQAEMDDLYNINTQISACYTEIENMKKKLEFFMKEKDSYLKKQTVEADTSEKVIQKLQHELEELKEKQKNLLDMLKSYETIFALLKDDGIKTVIIKNYLGIINALIKKYLNIIGYNISFSFDANFNETIKSRGRDIFEYNCFSEGERLRIDFCLLFTFRELAKLRSTINTNLLIIDEQDGKLDVDGTSSINALLSSMDGNLIVISQYGEIYEEIATKQIIMEKDKHFSKAVVL